MGEPVVRFPLRWSSYTQNGSSTPDASYFSGASSWSPLPQLDQAGVDVSRVGPVFIGHRHFDYIDELFAVIISPATPGREGTLPIYGPAGTQRIVNAWFIGGGP